MSKLTLFTGPSDPPLTATDLRTHLRIDDSTEDTYLGELVDVARATLEEIYWTQFVTATYDQYFDRFAGELELRKPPLGEVTSVKYTDVAGDEQTVATSVWEEGAVDGVGVLRLKYQQTWPSDVRGHPDSVVARFAAGYGEPGNVPGPIRHAMKLLCGHLHRHRGIVVVGTIVAQLPMSVQALMAPYSFRKPSR